MSGHFKDLCNQYIHTMMFDRKDPAMRGANFSWEKFPETVASYVSSIWPVVHKEQFLGISVDDVEKYIMEEAERRIKNKEHLPEAMIFWIRKLESHSKARTVRNWLHETIEGEGAFGIAKYAKERNMLDMRFFDFVAACDDTGMKWNFVSKFGYAFRKNLVGIAYENEVVRYRYKEKPKHYTIDVDSCQHLGWFIELAERDGMEDLLKSIRLQLNISLYLILKDNLPNL